MQQTTNLQLNICQDTDTWLDMDKFFKDNVTAIDKAFSNKRIDITWPKFGGKCDDLTDDTAALKAAINALPFGGEILVPGPCRINDTLDITADGYRGIRLVGNGRTSKITMTTDNKPIINLGGMGNILRGLSIGYLNNQDATKTNANAIQPMQLYESIIEDVQLFNVYAGVYVPQVGVNGKGTNFIFSVSFRNIEIQTYSGYAMYLKGFGAGNTGCLFQNIYTNNQVTRGSAVLQSAEVAFHLEGFSESIMQVVNAEHGKLKAAFRFVDCDTMSVQAPHIEGVTFTTNNRGVFENIRSKVRIQSGAVIFNTIDPAVQYGIALLYFEDTGGGNLLTTFNVDNITERNTTLNGKSFWMTSSPNALYPRSFVWQKGVSMQTVGAGGHNVTDVKVIEGNGKTYISATTPATTAFAAGVSAKVVYSAETTDSASEYDPTTGRFTVKQTGAYIITAALRFTAAAANNYVTLSVWKNGANFRCIFGQTSGTGTDSTSASGTITAQLNAGDYIEVYAMTRTALTADTAADSTYLTIAQL